MSNQSLVARQAAHVRKSRKSTLMFEPRSQFKLKMRLLRRSEIEETLNSVTGPLHRAAKEDAAESLATLLTLGGKKAGELDCAQQTPMHYAASRATGLECMRILVENNGDVNAKDVWHGTPLHNAVRAGHIDNVHFLLEQGRIDVNAQNLRRWTPLHIAVALQRLDLVKTLVKHNADLTLANEVSWLFNSRVKILNPTPNL
jgi:ankyrin repeat protein